MVLLEGDSKNLTEAKRLQRQSIRLEPQFPPVRIALGKLLNVQLAPPNRNPSAQYQIAPTYRKLGDLERSRAALTAFKNMKAERDSWKIVF